MISFGTIEQKKVKRTVLCTYTPMLQGGLNMTDIVKQIEAIQIEWVKRLTSPETSNWKVIPRFFDNFGIFFFLIFNMNIENMNSISNINKYKIPDFYFEIIKT